MIKQRANTLDTLWGGNYRNSQVKQIGINGKTTYGDFGLLLAPSPTLSMAEARTRSVQIPGKDGELDLTTAMTKDVIYNNRTLDFELIFMAEKEIDRTYTYRDFSAFCHGKKTVLTLSDDGHDTYMIGRVDVGVLTQDGSVSRAKVSVDLEPWRYRKNDKVYSYTVGNTPITTTLINEGRKLVNPSITTNRAITVIFGDKTIEMSAGSYIVDEIDLTQGNNTLSIVSDIGDATVIFKYKEAWL